MPIERPWLAGGAAAACMVRRVVPSGAIIPIPRESGAEVTGQSLEEAAELTPEFIASIERGQADLRQGRVRVRQS